MITASLSFNESLIPDLSKSLPQWVNWKAILNGERIEKIPVCAETGCHASSTDPDTWTDFPTAVMKAFTAESLGIGFVFTQDSGITGIDLDKCQDPESGVLEPWADVIGELPAGRMKKGRIEAYWYGRFFTVTGQHLEGTPATVEERTRQLLAFHARCLAEPIPPATPAKQSSSRTSLG